MYHIITAYIKFTHIIYQLHLSQSGKKERCSTSYVMLWWEINQWDTTEHWLEWPQNTVEQQELSLTAGGNAKWDKNHTHTLLFVFAETWSSQNVLQQVNEQINIQTMEYYLAIIRNELSNHGKTWRKLNGLYWVKAVNLKRLYLLYDYNDMTS